LSILVPIYPPRRPVFRLVTCNYAACSVPILSALDIVTATTAVVTITIDICTRRQELLSHPFRRFLKRLETTRSLHPSVRGRNQPQTNIPAENRQPSGSGELLNRSRNSTDNRQAPRHTRTFLSLHLALRPPSSPESRDLLLLPKVRRRCFFFSFLSFFLSILGGDTRRGHGGRGATYVPTERRSNQIAGTFALSALGSWPAASKTETTKTRWDDPH
jgi:hypothetical protein